MTPDDMKKRTKNYALRLIKLVDSLPQKRSAHRLGDQLLRAATSVGANYRAACRARSGSDFINKLRIVEEECDESLYWIEILVESGLVPLNRVKSLVGEGDQILAIIVASAKTARARAYSQPNKKPLGRNGSPHQSSIVTRQS
jgi:four helix bundle protein